MIQVSACGWLLSVLRAPSGTGIYTLPQHQNSIDMNRNDGTSRSGNAHTLSTSCDTLTMNGLNENLGELLLIIYQSSVEEVIIHLGIKQFAAKVRASAQLKKLLTSWMKTFHPEEIPIGLLGGTNENYNEKKINKLITNTEEEIGIEIGNNGMCNHLMNLLERNCLNSNSNSNSNNNFNSNHIDNNNKNNNDNHNDKMKGYRD